ncbi:MAG: SRPBCC domain-containing protein [Candidatus Paceibacterota bacterium]
MNEKEITITREYNASLEQVWKAWTEPELLKQWWGPDNVSIPECEVDLKVGGKFHIVMEAGEAMGPYAGTKWPMLALFTEIEPNTRLAYSAKAWTEGMEDTTQIEQTTEISLSEKDGKTTVQVKAAISKTGPDAGMAVQGMEQGFNQQLDKLTGFLEKTL